MDLLRQAAQQALEALENPWRAGADGVADSIEALRAALAQPEQEPVAWNWVLDGKDYGPVYYGKPPDADITKQAEQRGRTVRLLYTAPPQRKPLTNEEIQDLAKSMDESVKWPLCRAIEKAHGIE